MQKCGIYVWNKIGSLDTLASTILRFTGQKGTIVINLRSKKRRNLFVWNRTIDLLIKPGWPKCVEMLTEMGI